MVKLLKNEWRRYHMSLLIILICTVGIAVLLGICIAIVRFLPEDETSQSITMLISNVGSMSVLSMLLLLVPYCAYIYPVISYATDVSKKGMVFLTPTPVWKVILSKVLFGAGVYIVTSLLTGGSVWLLRQIFSEEAEIFETVEEMLLIFYSDEDVPDQLMLWLSGFISLLHAALMIMASISLGRFVAMSTAAQVILAIVFYYLISMIEGLLQMLIALIISHRDLFDWSFELIDINPVDRIFQVIYAAILYVVCVCLTDRKVNIT